MQLHAHIEMQSQRRSHFNEALAIWGLNGEIPKEISQLQSLQQLYLDQNQLSGEIPKELSQLQSLQTLTLAENQLSGKIPKELSQLQSLQQLYLDQNQLSGEIPKELSQLQSLQTLTLCRKPAEWQNSQGTQPTPVAPAAIP